MRRAGWLFVAALALAGCSKKANKGGVAAGGGGAAPSGSPAATPVVAADPGATAAPGASPEPGAATPAPSGDPCTVACAHRHECGTPGEVEACAGDCRSVSTLFGASDLASYAQMPCDRVTATEPAFQAAVMCKRACDHRAECISTATDLAGCLDACVSLGFPADALETQYVKADCATVEQSEPQFQQSSKCLAGCRHVLECGVAGDLPSCLQLCDANLKNGSFDLAAVDRITGTDCPTVKQTITLQPAQPAPGPFGQNGGGTMSDCSRVGGSLVGGVCAQTFACKKLRCPGGWHCGVEGFCHHDQFPNCMRCP